MKNASWPRGWLLAGAALLLAPALMPTSVQAQEYGVRPVQIFAQPVGQGYAGSYGRGGGDGGAPVSRPHQAAYEQYQRVKAQREARLASAASPCGSYNRMPLACRQRTTRWDPLVHN